jgi:hypothetical protein
MLHCITQTPSLIETIWKILNGNLVSALLGSVVFGIVAGLVLNALIGRRERKALIKQVEVILKKTTKEILETHDLIEEQLKKGSITLVPNPLIITPLQVILQGKFVEVMDAELVSEVANTYRYCTMLNANYDRLADLITGPALALSNASEIRQSLIEECQKQLPGLKASVAKIEKLLPKKS